MPKYRDVGAYTRWQDALRERRRLGFQDEPAAAREHGAYAESRTREHPVYGPVEQLALIPGYALAKALRLKQGTPPSLEQLAAGYRGVGRGTAANIGDMLLAARNLRGPLVPRRSATPPMSQGLSQEQIAQLVRRGTPRPMLPESVDKSEMFP